MTKAELLTELLAIANEACSGHARSVYVKHLNAERPHRCEARVWDAGNIHGGRNPSGVFISIDTGNVIATRKEDLAMLHTVYRSIADAVQNRFGGGVLAAAGFRVTCAKKPGSTGFWNMGRFCETSFYRVIEIKDVA
jgi:hypothetical protein